MDIYDEFHKWTSANGYGSVCDSPCDEDEANCLREAIEAFYAARPDVVVAAKPLATRYVC